MEISFRAKQDNELFGLQDEKCSKSGGVEVGLSDLRKLHQQLDS